MEHFRERHNQRELLVVDIQFEQRPAADNLQIRKDNLANVDVRDQHVAGDLNWGKRKTKPAIRLQ